MSVSSAIETDVLIIGAGPVGLFAVFECGMHKLSTCVVDALPHVGGQCSALYPEKPIYDIPAHPGILAQELVDNLQKQAEPFHPNYLLSQSVISIESLSDLGNLWQVKTSAEKTINCKAIILAAGVGAFGPNKPPLKNLSFYENQGAIHYSIRQKEIFRDKDVVIAGGGDSAVDWALILKDIASSVKVVHRRAKFRAAPDSEEKLNAAAANGEIEIVTPFQLKALHGDATLTHVEVETLDGDSKMLKADYLVPFFGLSMNLGPITEWGLGFDKKCISIEQSTSCTNRPGIYAIGDVATYLHKQKLILTGFAEAAQAAHSIRRFLFPDEVVHFEYSTTKGVPVS